MNPSVDLGAPGKALVALIAAGLFTATLAFVPSPLQVLQLFDSVPEIEVKAPSRPRLATMPALTAYESIKARPLFNVGRKPDPWSSEEPGSPLTGDLAQYKVEGVVGSSEMQLALVRKAGAELLTLKRGDSFDGWKVDKIEAKGVFISRGDRVEVLVIPKAENRSVGPGEP